MITIVNYGSGNISAISNIYKKLNIPFCIANTAKDILTAEKIILPGVGSFDFCMGKLNESGLKEALNKAVILKHIPVLGICIGLQIMADCSDEGVLLGLGWIKGEVKKFDISTIASKPKIPHMGWNSINIKAVPELFSGIDESRGFYFIHSYYIEVEDDKNIMTTTNYGIEFVSSVHNLNIYAVQFHPEKSHSNGVCLLKNFSELKC